MGRPCQAINRDTGECAPRSFCAFDAGNNKVCTEQARNRKLCAVHRGCLSHYCDPDRRMCCLDPDREHDTFYTPQMSVLLTMVGVLVVSSILGVCVWLIRDHQRQNRFLAKQQQLSSQ